MKRTQISLSGFDSNRPFYSCVLSCQAFDLETEGDLQL